MRVCNKIMLITYPDSMGGNLPRLESLLDRHFRRAVGGIHLLPFFPSSADRGFAPITYDRVDPAFGDWDTVKRLGEKYYLMFDFMVNHISRQSEYFRDFQKRRDESPYRDFFIRYKDFWPGGEPTRGDLGRIYKRKPRAPYTEVRFGDGAVEKLWCTFSEEQLDLNVRSEKVWEFYRRTLTGMARRGAAMIRLDAFAYAVKKRGTSCFFVEPEIWDFLGSIEKILKPCSVEPLLEMHEHYSIQMKLAGKGYWVYDFALPMLTLHSLYTGNARRLKEWFAVCPRKQFTTLDTHDGIGVVDVKGLMSDREIEETVDLLYQKGANVKRVYSSAEYHNLDIYQINCTFYSALGNDDDAYLLARAIQFFAPGIPQVYYVGMLAGENDVALMEKTKFGRNINRHNYTADEVEDRLRAPVVQKLVKLMEFRNRHPAFGGSFEVLDTEDRLLAIRRRSGPYEAVLRADLKTFKFKITSSAPEDAPAFCGGSGGD